MSDSYIKHNTGSVAYVGTDAIYLMRAITLRSAIRLHQKTGMIPTRGMTITKLFKLATGYSQRVYKRGQHDIAIADLTAWIEAMKSALPVIQE